MTIERRIPGKNPGRTPCARSLGTLWVNLYRQLQASPARPVEIRLVPYYAWGNRGKGEMTVWMPHAR